MAGMRYDMAIASIGCAWLKPVKVNYWLNF
jgi:hypothetical protein